MDDYYINMLRSKYNTIVQSYIILLEWSGKKIWGGLLFPKALNQVVILFDTDYNPLCLEISGDGVQSTPVREMSMAIHRQKNVYLLSNTSRFDGQYTMVKACGENGSIFNNRKTADKYIEMRWGND